jgi:hypothetical protein
MWPSVSAPAVAERAVHLVQLVADLGHVGAVALSSGGGEHRGEHPQRPRLSVWIVRS